MFIPQINIMYFCGNYRSLMTKKAIVVGASGLIGSNLLSILLSHPDYSEVLIIARKKTKSTNLKLKQIVTDLDHLNEHAAEITGAVIFCCIGTTKSQTPDENEYRKIDHDYPVKLAEIALKNGIEQFHLISAIGANEASSNFYLKTKGETERDVTAVGLPATFIYQPSVLVGRTVKQRLGEEIAVVVLKVIGPLLFGRFKKYRAIKAGDVAKAMFNQSLKNKTGVFIYTSDKITKRA